MEENKELVEFSPTINGSLIKNIFYEFETEKAVMFGRNEDEKVLWIPKRNIKGGWKKDKKFHQDIRVNYHMELYWVERKKNY